MQIGIDGFVAAIISHGDVPMTVRAMKRELSSS
jgi:FixJ family two-component response regulator